MRLIALFALLAAAAPAQAERAVTAGEFAAMVEGRTLHFDRYGEAFGSEQYFDDSRVIWAFENGRCQRGIWFENADGLICFVYESEAEPQCWRFLEMPGGGFHARLDGAEPEEDLVTRDITREPLDCPLPDLGV